MTTTTQDIVTAAGPLSKFTFTMTKRDAEIVSAILEAEGRDGKRYSAEWRSVARRIAAKLDPPPKR